MNKSELVEQLTYEMDLNELQKTKQKLIKRFDQLFSWIDPDTKDVKLGAGWSLIKGSGFLWPLMPCMCGLCFAIGAGLHASKGDHLLVRGLSGGLSIVFLLVSFAILLVILCESVVYFARRKQLVLQELKEILAELDKIEEKINKVTERKDTNSETNNDAAAGRLVQNHSDEDGDAINECTVVDQMDYEETVRKLRKQKDKQIKQFHQLRDAFDPDTKAVKAKGAVYLAVRSSTLLQPLFLSGLFFILGVWGTKQSTDTFKQLNSFEYSLWEPILFYMTKPFLVISVALFIVAVIIMGVYLKNRKKLVLQKLKSLKDEMKRIDKKYAEIQIKHTFAKSGQFTLKQNSDWQKEEGSKK